MAERGVMDSKVSSLLTYGAEAGIFPDFINAQTLAKLGRTQFHFNYFHFAISMMNNWRQGSI